MKLTCVTAVFNAIQSGNRERLIRCIQSVAALKTEHEHLIYDGASKDGTVEVLHELERTTPGLKIFSEPDAGVYNALNKGVRDARGEWFYVLGCDDYIIHPATFDRLIATEGSETELIIAPTIRDGADPLYKKISDLRLLFKRFPYSHQSVIMKTEIMRHVGGFDERFRIAADWKMLMTCYRENRKFKYYDCPITYYPEGGLSERLGTAYAETISVYAFFWGLNQWQHRLFFATGYVPLYRIMGAFRHKDPVVRMASHYMLRLWMIAALKIVLWPVVVLRRKILFG